MVNSLSALTLNENIRVAERKKIYTKMKWILARLISLGTSMIKTYLKHIITEYIIRPEILKLTWREKANEVDNTLSS